MKFLLDKVATVDREWRLIGDTTDPCVFIVDGTHVYEFKDKADAYKWVVGEYKEQRKITADFKSMQPGQSYSLPMTDGTQKVVNVQSQAPDGVMVLDPQSGQTMMIPHVQPGAEPKPVQPGQQNKSSAPGPAGVSPENRTYRRALGRNDLAVTAAEIAREPYYCKHDQGYLYRKNPSDPEKYCAQCGMVYAAGRKKGTWEDIAKEEQNRVKEYELKHKKDKSKEEDPPKAAKVAVITGGPGSYHVKSEEGKNLGGPYKSREQVEHRLKQVEYFKHKKSQMRERFRLWKNSHRVVTAEEIIKRRLQADGPMPGQQAMPTGDVANEGQSIPSNEKSPADFSEEPEAQPRTQDPNAKRKLTPHEIIEEAESLIRNALVKGVKIGAAELNDYMVQYYNNAPEELMQGITLAWQKVQYEEKMEGGGDPNAPQGEGFGPQAPVTPEQAAQMAPKNGPIRTKNI